MNVIHTRKRVDLRGRDILELEHRIQRLGQAVYSRGGSILDVKRVSGGPLRSYRAQVTYRVPLLNSGWEASTDETLAAVG